MLQQRRRNPLRGFDLVRQTSGINAVGLCALSALFEGGAPWTAVPAATHGVWGMLLLKSGCVLAWYTTEFLLVDRAGAVATTVVANVNRVSALAFSVALLRNPVTAVQIVGFGLTVGGVSAFLYDKAGAATEDQLNSRLISQTADRDEEAE